MIGIGIKRDGRPGGVLYHPQLAGRPLTSHEVAVQIITAIRTHGRLRFEAALDTGNYPTCVAITKELTATLPRERHATRSTWNYTLHP